VATLKSGTPNATGTREEEAKRVGDSGVEEERTERERESASKIHTHTHTHRKRERERGGHEIDRSNVLSASSNITYHLYSRPHSRCMYVILSREGTYEWV